MKMWRRGLAGMVVMLSLVACGNMVNTSMRSERELNRNAAGTSLPVVVRVYQLSDDTAFKNAAFRDLWKRDTEILGSSLLSSKEVVMQPDFKDSVSFPLNEGTKFVAGVAIFRNPDSSKWSFVEPVSNGAIANFWHKIFPVSISLRLNQNRIEIAN